MLNEEKTSTSKNSQFGGNPCLCIGVLLSPLLPASGSVQVQSGLMSCLTRGDCTTCSLSFKMDLLGCGLTNGKQKENEPHNPLFGDDRGWWRAMLRA